MTEKWKRVLDKNMKIGTFFTDHWNTFDNLNHRLRLAKFKAPGLALAVLKLTQSHLKVVIKTQK